MHPRRPGQVRPGEEFLLRILRATAVCSESSTAVPGLSLSPGGLQWRPHSRVGFPSPVHDQYQSTSPWRWWFLESSRAEIGVFGIIHRHKIPPRGSWEATLESGGTQSLLFQGVIAELGWKQDPLSQHAMSRSTHTHTHTRGSGDPGEAGLLEARQRHPFHQQSAVRWGQVKHKVQIKSEVSEY